MHLLFRFTVFGFVLSLFELDDVETKLALDDVANLTRLQCVSGLLKLGHHLAMPKPTEIATLVFTAVSRKLHREFAEIFTGAGALQDFFRLGAVLLVRVELRMARKIRVYFCISRLHLPL